MGLGLNRRENVIPNPLPCCVLVLLFSAMARGGGTPVNGLNGAAVRHLVLLEHQRMGNQVTLGVVWGE